MMDRHTDHLRFTVMLAGIEIMGIGVALFKLSLMGNDPHTALMIAIGDRLGVDFSLVLLAANCLWFLLEWPLGKELIGIGTFINWFLVGPLASLSEKAVLSFWDGPVGTGARLWLYAGGHCGTESGLRYVSNSGYWLKNLLFCI